MTTEPPTSCPSTFTLDRHLLGELAPSEAQAFESHLQGCASCQAQRANIAQFNAGFAEPLPAFLQTPNTKGSALAQPAPASSIRWKRFAWSGSAASAVAALAAGFFLWFSPSKPLEEIRTKGGGRLGYHVFRDGAVWLSGPNEELRENDAIQFIFAAAEPGFLAVFSVDGQGEVSSYYPGDGVAAAVYKPEQSRLSTSTVLDDALGEEVFVAVFCSHPFELKEMAKSLEEVKAVPEQLRILDCTVETLHAKKVGPNK